MKEWDVFISHASEDKDEFVRPLVEKLENLSISVWYDENCISYGDSIFEKISQGLEKSHIGIIVISKAFFNKNWTTFELGAFTLQRNIKKKILIPLLYQIDFQEVAERMPFLADIKALQCNDSSLLDKIASDILLKVNELSVNYTNIQDLELPDIAKLLIKRDNTYSNLIASHINKFSTLVKSDTDMAIVRAKIMLQTILKQVLSKELKIDDMTTVVNNTSILNDNIKEQFKMLFRFAEAAENNAELESVISKHNMDVTILTIKAILNWYINSYQSNAYVRKRKIVIIPVGEITTNDIVESFNIEKLLLRKELISPIEDVINWYNYNFYTMLGIRDESTGKLVGFANLLPVTDSCYEMLKSGNFPDINIKTSHIRKYDYPDFYKLYISSICIAPDYQNTEAFKILYNSLISVILDLAIDNEVYFSEILSDACTSSGERLSYSIGMKYLKDSNYNTKLYWGTLIPPSLRLRNNMGNSLINFYNNKFDEFKELLKL